MMGRACHSVILPRWRGFCCSSFFVAAVIAVAAAIGTSHAIGQGDASNQNTTAKIAPWVIEHTAAGQQAEFIVVLAEQANLSPARMLAAKSEKSNYVRDALWTKSQATQRPVLQWLAEQGIEHRSFYIVNAIWLKGTREIAEALAARPNVLRVEGNPHIQNVPPSPVVESFSQPQLAAVVEPGIAYTHAPLVWALGFTGQGIVVAGADTGFRWTHNAIKPHYRGWNGTAANHNYNWHDSIHDSLGNPCGNDSPQSCDDDGHGTHTIGTVIGDDGGTNQIGMAPGAQCIGCRNMDQGDGTPARYIECMEFFLAPYPIGGTPADGDPTKAPDVTNNSWGCPPSEGCSAATLQAAVEAQRAAGIEMVVASGNSGPGCFTVVDPPSIYDASYTVGALTTDTDNIASFSSRGPVSADASNRMKPDITAPGTNTRSCLNNSDSAYGTLSGTSMATPHVAGGVALLWSARPEFRHNIDATEGALNNSAAIF
jgi:Subtilisin-like serine proteases